MEEVAASACWKNNANPEDLAPGNVGRPNHSSCVIFLSRVGFKNALKVFRLIRNPQNTASVSTVAPWHGTQQRRHRPESRLRPSCGTGSGSIVESPARNSRKAEDRRHTEAGGVSATDPAGRSGTPVTKHRDRAGEGNSRCTGRRCPPAGNLQTDR